MIIHGHRFSDPKPPGKPIRYGLYGVFAVIDRRSLDCMSCLPPRIISVGTIDEMALVAFPWRHPQYFAWITAVESLSDIGLSVCETESEHHAAALVHHIRATADVLLETPGGLHRLYRDDEHRALRA